MSDAQTWTVIGGLLAALMAMLGLTTRFMTTTLTFAVDTLRAEIRSLGSDLGARIDQQGYDLGARIDQQGHDLREEMRERFALVDKRFDSLDRRIDGIDTDVQTLTRRFLDGGGAA